MVKVKYIGFPLQKGISTILASIIDTKLYPTYDFVSNLKNYLNFGFKLCLRYYTRIFSFVKTPIII